MGENRRSAGDRRWHASRQWDQLVAEVRAMPGNEMLQAPFSSADLQAAAENGPVFVINVSSWRCDALVVRHDAVKAVELPLLTRAAAVRTAEAMLTALRDFDSALDAFHYALSRLSTNRDGAARSEVQRAALARRAAHDQVNMVLLATLFWLWTAIVEPLLPYLPSSDEYGAGGAPRVWWCPTGPLAYLPIHAAGHYAKNSRYPGEGGSWLMDLVTSSYTPTVRSLAELRRRVSHEGAPEHEPQCLVVAPSADLVYLTGAGSADRTEPAPPASPLSPQDFSVPGARTIRLLGRDATVSKVVEELRRSRWVHFDSHADQDIHEPSLGGFTLADGPLSILDLAILRLDGDFAGLAGCKTAQGGVDVPDEVITLASALHYAGYRHVVASLWSLGDSTATAMFRAFYARLSLSGQFAYWDAAVALGAEIRRLKAAHPGAPHLWASLIHVGP